MGVLKGNNEGLVFENQVTKKGEPLVTIAKIKATYLFGVKVRDRETGALLPDAAYQNALDLAVSYFEHFLDISISPVRQHIEYKDYHLNDYAEWGYMQLDNYPVESITQLQMVYFRDEDGLPVTVQVIPNSWIRLQNHDGTLRLIPNTRFPSQLQINEAGSFFPEILRATEIPHLWQITYDYGFCSGNIPTLLNQCIGMMAASIVLITAGHLILGAGIGSTNIGLDGLSQGIQTTQSAENSGFSAVIKDFKDFIFGKVKDDPFAAITILKNFYKGQTMNIL